MISVFLLGSFTSFCLMDFEARLLGAYMFRIVMYFGESTHLSSCNAPLYAWYFPCSEVFFVFKFNSVTPVVFWLMIAWCLTPCLYFWSVSRVSCWQFIVGSSFFNQMSLKGYEYIWINTNHVRNCFLFVARGSFFCFIWFWLSNLYDPFYLLMYQIYIFTNVFSCCLNLQ